jgi:hypothetical protein
VALHFAVESPADFGADGVIWCVNFVDANHLLPRKLKSILEEERSDTLTVDMLREFPSLKAFDSLTRDPFLVFIEPPSLDARILNQFALFSLMSSPKVTMDEWIAAHPQMCRRVVVPAELKWEIRDKLDQANVNERILFPGLDGLSRWLGRYYLRKGRVASGTSLAPLDTNEEDPRHGPDILQERRAGRR